MSLDVANLPQDVAMSTRMRQFGLWDQAFPEVILIVESGTMIKRHCAIIAIRVKLVFWEA